MPAPIEAVAHDAMLLPPEQRVALARELLESVALKQVPSTAAALEPRSASDGAGELKPNSAGEVEIGRSLPPLRPPPITWAAQNIPTLRRSLLRLLYYGLAALPFLFNALLLQSPAAQANPLVRRPAFLLGLLASFLTLWIMHREPKRAGYALGSIAMLLGLARLGVVALLIGDPAFRFNSIEEEIFAREAVMRCLLCTFFGVGVFYYEDFLREPWARISETKPAVCAKMVSVALIVVYWFCDILPSADFGMMSMRNSFGPARWLIFLASFPAMLGSLWSLNRTHPRLTAVGFLFTFSFFAVLCFLLTSVTIN